MNELHEFILPAIFMLTVLGVTVYAARSHAHEVERLHKINQDLLNRLMSRDYGEYRAVERGEDELLDRGNPFLVDEDENSIDFQMLGDEFDLTGSDIQRGE